uniref:Uncharacterized protein n=1 Tax=Rhizophora mucronata TaxID=61149 RepID=A0A2P2LCL7_RHIMU
MFPYCIFKFQGCMTRNSIPCFLCSTVMVIDTIQIMIFHMPSKHTKQHSNVKHGISYTRNSPLQKPQHRLGQP